MPERLYSTCGSKSYVLVIEDYFCVFFLIGAEQSS